MTKKLSGLDSSGRKEEGKSPLFLAPLKPCVAKAIPIIQSAWCYIHDLVNSWQLILTIITRGYLISELQVLSPISGIT